MVAGPLAATPVTVTLAEVVPAAMLTVAGTVTAPVLLELRLTVMPPVGAWPPAKFKVSVPVPPPAVTFKDVGVKAIVGAVTVARPVADIVILLPFHVETVPVIVEVPMD